MAKLFYSRGGVLVYADYKDNIIVDPDHPILLWKANKDKLRPSWFSLDVQRGFLGGLSKIASQHSEDALTWNVFRTLQLNDRIQRLTDIFSPRLDIYKIWFWGRDADMRTQEIDPEIQECLNQMEPWGKNGVKQQTEPDIILRGKSHVVMVECKLGRPGEKVKAWQRGRSGMRSEYLTFMDGLKLKLCADSFHYEHHGNRFYQLFRNYLLGASLALKWETQFLLVAIVNEFNSNLEDHSHRDEFNSFRSVLAEPRNTFLVTWQQIWNALPRERKLLPLLEYMMKHTLLSP